MVSNLAQELVDFAIKFKWEDLPALTIREVKYLFLDSLGCLLAAISTDKGQMCLALARRLGGPPESSIIGMSEKVSCNTAALTNGELINTLDYDALMSGAEPAPCIIPTSLALAEIRGTSGKDFILANAIGYEIAARMLEAIQSPFDGFKNTKSRQFSSPERAGIAKFNFGAAAAAGKIINLDQNKMLNALGIAGHLSPVLTTIRFTFSEHRYMNKYGSPGWQNTGAIMAVLLAEMGYIGDTTVLDPEHGFWKFCGYGGWHPDKIKEGLGETWNFTKIKFKKYPCCGMLHTALDCLNTIIKKNNLMPEDIDSIKAFCHPNVEFPAFANREIGNIIDAQFNPVYVFAVAAHRIPVGVEWQDPDTINNPKILNLMQKITCQAHPDFGKQRMKDPTSDLGKVEVLAKGKKYIEERTHFGDASGTGVQIIEQEIVEKFKHNASRILTQNKIENMINLILNMEKLTNISEMMEEIKR